MLKVDLHIHSNISDGSDSIENIIAMAQKNGVDVIAITDHDTLSHQRKIPAHNPVGVMAGIEISAIDPTTKIKAHILGYHIENVGLVESVTTPILEKRHLNSLKQVEVLKKKGYLIEVDTLAKADGKYIYKQHIMEQMVKTGQASNMFGEFYKNTFKEGGICDFDIEYLNVFDAVKVITEAGGKAVLAHSGQQQNFYLIEKLIPLGLVGLEYNHPENSQLDKEIILEYSKKYNLFLTGGSDYHGKNDKIPHQIGSFISHESGVSELC